LFRYFRPSQVQYIVAGRVIKRKGHKQIKQD